ncbi:MAG: DUF4038 domain-containing protein [Anaerolineales bacterium]|nr:DUF4038 domain-containing protein [Anaerolineales bacterium]
MRYAKVNCMTEFPLTAARRYADPFNQVSLDVVFSAPDGSEQTVPAFWAGEDTWIVRFAPAMAGRYHYHSVCSEPGDAGLHGQTGVLEAQPYEGSNPLLQHGPLRVAATRRHLEHRDGTPFFWLGDTWWHGLAGRLRWPQDVQMLAADRVAKGFSLVQIVAGLLPELVEERFWSEWSANDGGWAWEPGFSRINPRFFDEADLRLGHLVRVGLAPCIVGAWGYYLKYTGVEKMKQHWRYLVARYGAYPVVWCLAGEVNMPTYDSPRREEESRELKAGWTEVARYLRQIDPYHHPITGHPSRPDSREMVEDETLMDVDMLQTGHGYAAIEPTVRSVQSCVAKQPRYPVLIGEVCYEGEYGSNWQDMQRFFFWTSMVSGSAGHTYGANNIWQMNSPEHYFVGIRTYGDLPWYEAMHLPGSTHMGVGRRLLERYPWWQLEPLGGEVAGHPERISPFAARIPGKLWVIYLPGEAFEQRFLGLIGQEIAIEPGADYRAYFLNPRDGREIDLGRVQPGADGRWAIPVKPTREDMVLILEAR